MSPSHRLNVEPLEDRTVPVTWGNPWPDATHLTLSFAPDATAVGDRTSELFRVLDTVAPRAVWQREILRAFQTWAVQGNINIGLVSDGGQLFGAAGRPQGDFRFGDIRVGGYEMSREVLAIASPFEATAGTWSGDVKLNTAYNFGLKGRGEVDLFTVLLHEAAHTLGLDHSIYQSSAVYPTYNGAKTGLGGDDIARLRELYGARSADLFEGSKGNGSFANATRLNLLSNPNGSLGIAADGDITTLGDKDFYRFAAPLSIGKFTVRLRTEGLSLLGARVTVYDSNQRVVASAVSTDPLNNDLTLQVNSLLPLLRTYYVKVESATGDVFGVGSYRLEIESTPLLKTLIGTLSTTTQTLLSLVNDDLHLNDTFLTSTLLSPLLGLTNGTSSRFDYAFKGSIRDSWDVDYYKITAPQTATPSVMTVMVWGTDASGLKPKVRVFDANRIEVQAEVLVNADGVMIVQVQNAAPGKTYYVKVEASEPVVGNYFLGIDFGGKAVQLQQLASAPLDAAHSTLSASVYVAKTELTHFVLSAEGAQGASVRMTILDWRGNVVASVLAPAGSAPVSLTQALVRGWYTIRFSLEGTPGAGGVTFTLKGTRLSDPIGPNGEDTTEAPAGSPPPPRSTESSPPPSEDTQSTPPREDAETYSYAPPPDESGSSSGDPYYSESSYYYPEDEWYWSNWSYDNRGLNEEDPYSDPYQTA